MAKAEKINREKANFNQISFDLVSKGQGYWNLSIEKC